MSPLIWAALAVVAGFAGLIWSADRFVFGAAAIARALGVSTLVIGLTVVSLGTSAPEIGVSLNAAATGAGELAVGNALGSNLANMGLVLGVTALLLPLPIPRHLLRQEVPVLLLVTLAAGLCLADGRLGRLEGIALLTALPLLLWLTVWIKRRDREPAPAPVPGALSLGAAIGWFVLGLAVLLVSARVLVWGAQELALSLGVSELVIGLTVIAVGTSLPELAASVMSALKGHHDIALGNVIGSNIFNILAVMGIPGLFEPLVLGPDVFARDYLAMAGLTTVLVFALVAGSQSERWWGRPAQLSWRSGAMLLVLYAGYYLLLVPQAGTAAV